MKRRDLLAGTGAALLLMSSRLPADSPGEPSMYGLIGKMKAVTGQREALIALMLEDVGAMPGCLGYVVARDPADADGIWITEVWDSAASHKASLSLPAVQRVIARAKPLIAGFGEHFETEPVGGHGLARTPA
ncbi:putative quinol monooxygenase [Pseudoxanthomonas beigongshangi]